jgi:hypothetical protein
MYDGCQRGIGARFAIAAITLNRAIHHQAKRHHQQHATDQHDLHEQHYQYLTGHGSLLGRGDGWSPRSEMSCLRAGTLVNHEKFSVKKITDSVTDKQAGRAKRQTPVVNS